MIDAEYLKSELQSLTSQRTNALAVAQQATGAIMLIESLLAKLETPQSLTMDDLKQALGASSLELVENKEPPH